MLIYCPNCGYRDSHEFTYAGDAERQFPALEAGEDTWSAYVYERANPMGRHQEFWQHTSGCRAVLVVERDTVTHEIRTTGLVGAQATIATSEAAQ